MKRNRENAYAANAHNPVTCYRFLVRGGARYGWVNGTGLHHRDVTDAADFRLVTHPGIPGWVHGATVYQVFPDRFASSGAARDLPSWARPAGWDDTVEYAGPRVATQLFGGDLAGVEAHLDHLERLGVTVLYLTPFFPARSNHRYDATTFDHVDPLLGGDGALASLVDAAHRRGIRVLGDLTTNHTGDGHEWFRRAQADLTATEAGFYMWGSHPDDYVGWLGVPSLPKLDLRDETLRRRVVRGPGSVVDRWLQAPYRLDGWRIDVANMTGRYADVDVAREVARDVRATMREANPDTWLVAEHGHDATADLLGDGWHGTMDYAGFTRPVWAWLADDPPFDNFLGVPGPVPSLPGAAVAATMREVTATVPWRSRVASMALLGSHDTARFRTTVGGDRHRHAAGAVLLFTGPATPMVFAGDEIGLVGVLGEDARRPMPWHRQDTWDTATLDLYGRLARLRRASPALSRGAMRWVHADDDSLTYLREHPRERVLVHVTRGEHPGLELPLGPLGASAAETLHGDEARVTGDVLRLPAGGPAGYVWRLHSPSQR